jgi:hypothetical protein
MIFSKHAFLVTMRRKTSYVVYVGVLIVTLVFIGVTVRMMHLLEPSLTGQELLAKKYDLKHPNNPVMYMDMKIGDEKIGRITFELYHHATPKTSENWRQICLGFKKDGKVYSYKGSIFHRIIKNFVTQGGDVTRGDGTGGIRYVFAFTLIKKHLWRQICR